MIINSEHVTRKSLGSYIVAAYKPGPIKSLVTNIFINIFNMSIFRFVKPEKIVIIYDRHS